MAGLNSDLVYLGAVKPIGSKIIINFNTGDLTDRKQGFANYDFTINADYVITGLSVTKTCADLDPAVSVPQYGGQALWVVVGKVLPNGRTFNSNLANPAEEATAIAQASFDARTTITADAQYSKKGAKAIAGVLNGPIIAINIVIDPTFPAPTALLYNTTTADSTQVVLANQPQSGTVNSQQKIRVMIGWKEQGNHNIDPSCLIEIEVAKFSATPSNGTNANSGALGLSTGEIVTP